LSTPVPPRGGSRSNRGRSTSNRPANRPGTNRPAPSANRGGARPGTRPPARGRQAAFQRKRRQQQLLFGGIGLVLVVVVVLVVVAVTGGGGSSGSTATPLASPAILRQITSVPPATLAAQAKSDPVLSPPEPITGAPLTENGLPKIVYIGAEYCPYCGGERWAMIMALSKFGTFTGIKQITSSASDDPSAIPTFSFLGASYRSRYLVFSTTETETVNRTPLQTPSPANAALEDKYDDGGGIPFMDLGGKWQISGASYDVTPMQHLSHATVAQAVATGSTKYASDIQSTAGTIISRLCNLTHGQPGSVCRSFPTVIGS
jgi:hypothetical protein